MREDLHNVVSRLWPKFCERFTHNLHDLGIAVVPVVCDRIVWIALAVAAAFILLTAIQTIISEAV